MINRLPQLATNPWWSCFWGIGAVWASDQWWIPLLLLFWLNSSLGCDHTEVKLTKYNDASNDTSNIYLTLDLDSCFCSVTSDECCCWWRVSAMYSIIVLMLGLSFISLSLDVWMQRCGHFYFLVSNFWDSQKKECLCYNFFTRDRLHPSQLHILNIRQLGLFLRACIARHEQINHGTKSGPINVSHCNQWRQYIGWVPRPWSW